MSQGGALSECQLVHFPIAGSRLAYFELRQSEPKAAGEVEDLYQEACLRLLRAGHEFDSVDHAWSYFKVVLRTVLVDRSRRLGRYLTFRRRIGRPLPYRTNHDDRILCQEVAERYPKYYRRAVAGGRDAAYYRQRLREEVLS